MIKPEVIITGTSQFRFSDINCAERVVPTSAPSTTATAADIVMTLRAAKELTIRTAAVLLCRSAVMPMPTKQALKRLLVELEIIRRSELPKASFRPLFTMPTPQRRRQTPPITCISISVGLISTAFFLPLPLGEGRGEGTLAMDSTLIPRYGYPPSLLWYPVIVLLDEGTIHRQVPSPRPSPRGRGRNKVLEMSPTEILIQVIGGVCLLLWGVGMVNKGLNEAFGSSLRRIISNSTSNRFKACFVGMGITALLQSSTAAVLIVSSFAARNVITMSPRRCRRAGR